MSLSKRDATKVYCISIQLCKISRKGYYLPTAKHIAVVAGNYITILLLKAIY